jgi:hypothetical protein
MTAVNNQAQASWFLLVSFGFFFYPKLVTQLELQLLHQLPAPYTVADSTKANVG